MDNQHNAPQNDI